MAASWIALKRVYSSSAAASSLFFKFFNPAARSISLIPSGALHRRSFNSNAPFDNDDRPVFRFSGSADKRRESNNEEIKAEYMVTSRGLISIKRKKGIEMRHDFENLYLRFDMPGFSKQHVKVWMEGSILTIKGEKEKEFEEDDNNNVFHSAIDLNPSLYRLDEMKAEMKNGLLNFVIPKLEITSQMKDFKE